MGRRTIPWTAALACGAVACGAPRVALAHHGVPVRIVTDRHAGPYVVSVWAAPDVGMGMLYVVYSTPDGVPFVGPATVRVGIAPVSGRLAEVLYEARPEPVRHGARFVAHVAFDRSEAWRVRIVTAGPAGDSEVRSQVEATPAGMLGPIGLVLYSVPFTTMGVLWWRAGVARRRTAGHRAALATY